MSFRMPDFNQYRANREIDLHKKREQDWVKRVLRLCGREDLGRTLWVREGELTFASLHACGFPDLLLSLPDDPRTLSEGGFEYSNKKKPERWLNPGGAEALYAFLFPDAAKKSRWDPVVDHPLIAALSQWGSPGYAGTQVGNGVIFRQYDRKLCVALRLTIEEAGERLGQSRFPVLFVPQREGAIVLMGLENYLMTIGWMDDPFTVVPEEADRGDEESD
jgi:hypothetical protein